LAFERSHQHAAQSRIGEYRLDRDNAADQKTKISREHGNRWDQCITQCVAKDHQAFGQSARASYFHIHTVERFHHAGARQSRDMRKQS
jgi:hypothetical protein